LCAFRQLAVTVAAWTHALRDDRAVATLCCALGAATQQERHEHRQHDPRVCTGFEGGEQGIRKQRGHQRRPHVARLGAPLPHTGAIKKGAAPRAGAHLLAQSNAYQATRSDDSPRRSLHSLPPHNCACQVRARPRSPPGPRCWRSCGEVARTHISPAAAAGLNASRRSRATSGSQVRCQPTSRSAFQQASERSPLRLPAGRL
jgi:hypothetical protein